MPIGAALSAIGGLVGGLASAGANLFMNERNNKTNAAQARLQNQWNIEQWNRENEYNLPVNQVQRMMDAGINPGLYYGQNQMINEAAASPEMTSAAGQLRAGYIDPMMLANIGLIDAQKEKTETEADVMAQKLPEELENLRQYRKESDKKIEELNSNILVLQEKLKTMPEERKLIIEKQLSEQFEREMRNKEFEDMCERTKAYVDDVAQKILESKSRVNLNAATVADLKAATKLKSQEYGFLALYNVERLTGIKLDNELKEKTKSLYDDQHELNLVQKELLGFQVDAGRIQNNRDAKWLGLLSGSAGSGLQAAAGAVDALVGAVNLLLSPAHGILSVGIK